MKIELTIKTDYLPGWGAWEGIRELVQNGRDAEVEFNAPLVVSHLGTTLRIENEGAELPHEALLLGHTSKSERGDLIGKFGEGLKLGLLALVRAGRAVKIRSGSEVWVPTIARSEKFNADVLVVDIQGGRENNKRVRVEVGGVTSSEWQDLRQRFLFLNKTSKEEVVYNSGGDLLLDKSQAGKIYVKGIFVQQVPLLVYGYNFNDADVDRDRKMISSYDMEYKTKKIWCESVGRRPNLFENFHQLVEDGKDDVRNFDSWTASTLPVEVVDRAAKEFLATYGAEAVPVANMNESAEIAHYGKRGIVVQPQHQALLERKLGKLEDVRKKLNQEAQVEYSFVELSQAEQLVYVQAVQWLKDAGVADLQALLKLHVVSFRSADLEGLYKDGEVFMARQCLRDLGVATRVLIHEVSHRAGDDGEKGHVATVEANWQKVAMQARRG